VIFPTYKIASRTLGVLPVGAFHPSPPSIHIAQVYRAIRRGKNERARLKHLVRRLGGIRRHLLFEFFPIDWPLCHRFVSSRIDKLSKFRVRHRMFIDPESID
jgi:hypothetical protein